MLTRFHHIGPGIPGVLWFIQTSGLYIFFSVYGGSLTAEMAAFLFLFVTTLYTRNIYHIVLLCTNIWSFFDTSDIILSEIEDLFSQIMHFL
jgi:hypothetical protein